MFDPREYLALAKQLRLPARNEANHRAAIGRAYYAAFLVARASIQARRVHAQPPAGRRWGSHETVIFAVGAIRAPGVRGVQKRLFRLKKLRTLADYDLEYVHAERDAERAIRDAERVIDWFDALSGVSEANRYSAAWFDLFLAEVDPAQTAREVAFLIRNLPTAPAGVLDVACGYGRHAAPLAEAGFEVLGIDRDAAVIERAKAAHSDERLTFRTLDVTRLDELDGSFDVAICMWQSFGYGDAATNAEVVRQMAARLRPGGRLVLDMYNRRFFESRQGERETTQRGAAIVTRQRLESGRLIVDLDYRDRGERDRFDWQVFTVEEIVALADRCGLKLRVACTGFDEALPPSADQPRMQLVFGRS